MNVFKKITLLALTCFVVTGCFNDDLDDNVVLASEINDYIWKGLNLAYLYKDEVPDLANDRFSTDEEYGDFLNSFDSPESIFNNLLTQETTNGIQNDRFSIIVSDFIALEQLFDGVTRRNGIEFNLYRNPNNTTEVFGVVRLVLPNSEASATSIKRGDIFTEVDGVGLNETNFSELLSPDSYTLGLATYNDNGTESTSDDTIELNGESISLSKQPYTENPVFITEVLEIDGQNIGYLMYNGFTADFNSQLNAAFGQLAGVDHLVLDLRYNPGGSVNTSILLSSMITGQFTGDVFSTEEWNSDLQAAFEEENPEALINRFTNNDDGAPLNSLNLSEVYIITTQSSASASELVISALLPYINVKQVGDTTSGKFQASITLYDSDDFGRQGANPGHTYAMQPLVLKSVNANGLTDYFEGLSPDPELQLLEDFRNFGILGDVNEPLLALALSCLLYTSPSPRD